MKPRSRETKTLAWLVALTMVLALLPAAVFAQPAEAEPVAADLDTYSAMDSSSLEFGGVDGQEYAIAAMNDGLLDWTTAIEPDGDSLVRFTGLESATAYAVYTRIKGGDGRAAITPYITTLLEGYSVFGEPLLYTPIRVEPDPEDADVLYQWYWDAVTVDGEGAEHHSLTAISGATDATYYPMNRDLGKTLAVEIMTRGYLPLDTVYGIGPVYAPLYYGSVEADALSFLGEEGQEYLILPAAAEPDDADWASAVEPTYDPDWEDWCVEFTGLTPATEYAVYTRPVGSSITGARYDTATCPAEALEIIEPEAYTVGATVSVTPQAGLSYQWCREVIVEEGEGWSLTSQEPIPGATGTSYTITGYDMGQTLALTAFVGGRRMETCGGLGPVETPEGAPELSAWDQTTIDVRGAAGWEYAIAPKGGAPDWTQAKTPDADGFVTFDGLTAATEYEIHGRAAGGTGDGAVTSAVTLLESIGLDHEDELTIGSVVTADPDPANAAYTYQWYRHHSGVDALEAIPGATGRNYTATAEDTGCQLTVKIYLGGGELSDAETFPSVRAATESAPVRPYIYAEFPGSIMIEGVWGQEYVLVEGGTDPDSIDWDEANWEWMLGDEPYIEFDGLSLATTYDIYTRIMESSYYLPSEAVKTSVTTGLFGMWRTTDYLVGCTLEAGPDDEVEGLDYQWCYGVETIAVGEYEGWDRTDYFPIAGATGSSYVLTENEVGKYLAVRMFKNGVLVGEKTEIGPIVDAATVEFDSDGGSEIEPQTGLVFGDKIEKPADPTRFGCTFLGWYHYDDVAWDFDNDTVDSDWICLTAKWRVDYVPEPASESQTVTVPVSGEEETVNLTVEIKDDVATVTGADVEKVLEAEAVGTVTIDVSGLDEGVTEAVIPNELLTKIADAVADENSDADGMEIRLPGGSVSFDAAAVAVLAEQTDGEDLKINLCSIGEDELNPAQHAAVASMDVAAVYDAYVSSGGERISDFRGGTATVSVPCELEEGQSPGGFAVYYVAADGSLTRVVARFVSGILTFRTGHFSNYVVVYDAALAAACTKDAYCPISDFSDSSPTAWYHDALHYVLENGIMEGTADDKFAPEKPTSRAMIAQILWNMEGRPASSCAISYTDVADGAWYTEAIRWATDAGIFDGYSDGTFRPTKDLTREELATVMYRYAQTKGLGFTGMWMFLLNYEDAAEVSDWADEAMHWMVMHHVIEGKTETTLDPKDPATRAQVAQILMNYDQNVN